MARPRWFTSMRLLVILLAALVALSACAEDEAAEVDDDAPEEDVDDDAVDDDDEDAVEDDDTAEAEPDGDPIEITILENAVRGGKNSVTADWLHEDVIPAFEEMMAEEGRDVTVNFEETGVEDEDYKTQIALDLSVGEGADVMGFDQFWVSEFYAAGYLEPLDQVVGDEVHDWEGWDNIPEAVAGGFELDGEQFGIPFGTDGRVIYYRQDIFEDAGLDPEWNPSSWEDILETGRQLADANPDVIPLQWNAGTSMGEATTMQGFLPLVYGTGTDIYDGGWLGESPELQQVLELYETIYVEEELGDADLQLRSDARDRSMEMFADGEIAVLAEGDWFWRAVIEPEEGLFPVEDRDDVVGYTMIPAMEPGSGIRGQDFVSASGGTGRVLNPASDHPDVAWEFLSYTGSEEAVAAFVEREPRITAREDVNEYAVDDDPLLVFIAEEVLDVTEYRPGFEEYPQISEELQLMSENVVSGRESVQEAMERYESSLESIVGADEIR